MNNIYLCGQSLSAYGARLRQNYTISGCSTVPTVSQGKNDSRFFLLDRTSGLLTVTLPLDFYGENVREIAKNMAYLRGKCQEMLELDLGDGFRYRLILTGAGEQEWTEDVLCSQTLTFQGMRLGDKMTVSGVPYMTLHNPGTWAKTACRLTIHGFKTTARQAYVCLRQNGKSFLTWQIAKHDTFSGGDLVLDGIDKTNSYGGKTLPEGSMFWTEYPYLLPGENGLLVTGCEFTDAVVEWEPGYV